MIRLEIWSDVLCPFCYIGKRHLEEALRRFEARDEVQVVWRSFQLDPEAERDPGMTTYEMLSRKYGQSVEQAKRMASQVAQRAAAVGLRFDFDRALPTNSFDAHRLIHLAAKHGLQDQAEERLFSAYFTEGRRIGDPATLLELAVEIGLDREEAARALRSDACAADVRKDCAEAEALGITGVPFFVIDRKYAVSGAQPVETFLKALETAIRGR